MKTNKRQKRKKLTLSDDPVLVKPNGIIGIHEVCINGYSYTMEVLSETKAFVYWPTSLPTPSQIVPFVIAGRFFYISGYGRRLYKRSGRRIRAHVVKLREYGKSKLKL